MAAGLQALSRTALSVQADVIGADDLRHMVDEVRHTFRRLDVLVMNASGGLMRDGEQDYAMQLNLHAQVALLDACLLLLPRGAGWCSSPATGRSLTARSR